MTNGCGHVRSVYARAVNPHTVTVNYVVPEGYTAPAPARRTSPTGTAYRFPTPEIGGLKPDKAEVSGTIGETDETFTVTYTVKDPYHTLTINFLVPQGFTAPASRSWKLKEGEFYAVISPKIEGLLTDNDNPRGMMGDEDLTINVEYYETYYVRVDYRFPESFTKAADYTMKYWFKPGESYSIKLEEYDYVDHFPAAVSGVMGRENVFVTVTYDYNQSAAVTHWLTVNYSVPEGFTAPAPHKEQVAVGAQFSVASPELQDLAPSIATVTGTMGEADMVVNVSYWKCTHRLTVNYSVPAGYTAPAPYVAQIREGDEYVVRPPRVDGLSPSPSGVGGKMGKEDVTIEVSYTQNPVMELPYTLEIRYTVPEAFEAVRPRNNISHLSQGESYNIPSPAIEGLIPSVEAVTGVMPGQNLSVEVAYRAADDDYYYVTVHYEVPQGYNKPQDRVMTGVPGTPFYIQSPEVGDLYPDREEVRGTVKNEDQEFTVTYQKTYLVWITYEVPEGFIAPAPVYYRALEGYHFRHESPTIDGLFVHPWYEVLEGTVAREDIHATVYYNRGVTLRVIYTCEGVEGESGPVEPPAPYVENFRQGEGEPVTYTYRVESPKVQGLKTSVPVVEGEIRDKDVTRFVKYELEEYTLTFIHLHDELFGPDNVKVVMKPGETCEYYPPEIPGCLPEYPKYTYVMGTDDHYEFIQYERAAVIRWREGQNQTVNKASDGAHFRADEEHLKFTGTVRVDGKEIQRGKDFLDSSGSTVIDLTPEFLETLNAGEHTLTVYFEDRGVAYTTFTTTYNERPMGKYSISLNLADGFGLNVTVGGFEDYEGLTISWLTRDGKSVHMPVTDGARTADGRYAFTVGTVAAKEMTDVIPVMIRDADGVILKQLDCSVKKYCELVESLEGYDNLKALCRAALNYGAFAQKYFGYRTDDLANPNADPAALPAVPAEFAPTMENPCTGLTGLSLSLVLKSATQLNVYLFPASGYTADKFSIAVTDEAGNTVNAPLTTLSNGTLVLTIPGMRATTLGSRYTVTVKSTEDRSSTTATLCALSYAYLKQDAANAIAPVARALYAYYAAAKAFF